MAIIVEVIVTSMVDGSVWMDIEIDGRILIGEGRHRKIGEDLPRIIAEMSMTTATTGLEVGAQDVAAVGASAEADLVPRALCPATVMEAALDRDHALNRPKIGAQAGVNLVAEVAGR
mmetsp:Transcript_86159/g.129135  ORF Transcript_86159/g.129135 Transcript_86159/m.129135 type:complete len:117 (+) Transcript_86159:691-1041(+)